MIQLPYLRFEGRVSTSVFKELLPLLVMSVVSVNLGPDLWSWTESWVPGKMGEVEDD